MIRKDFLMVSFFQYLSNKIFLLMRKLSKRFNWKRIKTATGAFILCIFTQAQITFPVNGVADPRTNCYALTNATIVKDGQTTLNNATLVIRDGRITGVGVNASIPKDAVVINCSGKYLYPSLIDIYTDYGIPQPQRPTPAAGGFFAPQQFTTNTKGAYGWNQAIKSEVNASDIFAVDDKAAKSLRDLGFGSVLTHQRWDRQGYRCFVTLATKRNLVM
jgi:hypothetical protein